MELEILYCEKCRKPLQLGYQHDAPDNNTLFISCAKCGKVYGNTTGNHNRNQIKEIKKTTKGQNAKNI